MWNWLATYGNGWKIVDGGGVKSWVMFTDFELGDLFDWVPTPPIPVADRREKIVSAREGAGG